LSDTSPLNSPHQRSVAEFNVGRIEEAKLLRGIEPRVEVGRDGKGEGKDGRIEGSRDGRDPKDYPKDSERGRDVVAGRDLVAWSPHGGFTRWKNNNASGNSVPLAESLLQDHIQGEKDSRFGSEVGY
jgi:hypothetical protein